MSSLQRPRFQCVILDFDGTFTLVDQEAAPFEAVFRESLADVIGRPVDAMWEEEATHIRSRPTEFGWNIDGKVVAPSTSDPYLFATAVAQRVFDRVGILKGRALRAEVSQALYRDSYKHTATAFKPEAKYVLERLLETNARVVVVTNSHTDVVRKKLDQLAPTGGDKLEVLGDAKKFVVDEADPMDDAFARLPEGVSYPSLPGRQVLVRRGRYYEALRRIWHGADATPQRTLVCGDIFELDLALPAALGASVHLITSPNTLEYERRAVELLGDRGGSSASLEALLGRMGLTSESRPR